ncbi:Hypothetical predicted protein [Pelobates cultripes]|uniref:Uncharacterized protein n=1 Tax=Pelobates cultripes TaxID=61616 RepID=A0AAD1VUC9_PELCU|nr:Hypothetical predicted protein [Pelobates cultripes]
MPKQHGEEQAMDKLDEFRGSGGLHHPSSDEDSELPSTKGDIKALLRNLRMMFAADVATLPEETQTVEGRVKTMEGNLEDLTAQCIQLEAQNTELQRNQSHLTSCLDALEDRHRSRNVKIRGIPETVTPSDLLQYSRRLLASLLTPHQANLAVIDGVYRIPRATRALADTPRDVILQLQTRAAQLTLMIAVRGEANYLFEKATLSFYQDLSRPTVLWRNRFKPLTTTLHQHSIPYRWAFPWGSHNLLNRHSGNGLSADSAGIADIPSTNHPSPKKAAPSRLGHDQNTTVPAYWVLHLVLHRIQSAEGRPPTNRHLSQGGVYRGTDYQNCPTILLSFNFNFDFNLMFRY